MKKTTFVVLFLLYLLSLGAILYANYRAGDGGIWKMILNGFILSIPLALMYFSIGILISAYRQKRTQGYISGNLAKYIYRTPRIAAVLIITFLTLFSLDVFEQGGNILMMIGAFIIHSIPSIVLGLVLIFAWKRDWLGFAIFMVAATLFFLISLINLLQNFGIILLFVGPAASIAMLFWINWKWVNVKTE